MAKIRFNLKPSNSKEVQIMAFFQDGLKQPAKYTGFTIPSAKANGKYRHWNYKEQRARTSVTNDSYINKKLSRWEQLFEGYINECKMNGVVPNVPKFIKELDASPIEEVKQEVTLSVVFAEFIASLAKTHDVKTISHYQVTADQLKEYEQLNGVIKLDEVRKDFYMAYGFYLIETHGNVNNTINRKITRLVTVMQYAFAKEYISTKRYEERYTFKGNDSAKFALKEEEIVALANYKANTDYKQMCIDAFLFACESGLRYSDIKQLQPHHIQSVREGNETFHYLDFEQEKPDKQNTPPLSEAALAIISKYNAKGHLFVFEYSQPINRILKEAARSLKLGRKFEHVTRQGNTTTKTILTLSDEISFHMARNTFISRLLAANVPLVHVQKNAGHADIATTMIYNRQDDVIRWRETLKVLNKKVKTKENKIILTSKK